VTAERAIAVRSLHRSLWVDRLAVIRALRLLERHYSRLRAGPAALDDPGELSIVFLTDAALARLHGRFLSDFAFGFAVTSPACPCEVLSAATIVYIQPGLSGRSFEQRENRERLEAAKKAAADHQADHDAQAKVIRDKDFIIGLIILWS